MERTKRRKRLPDWTDELRGKQRKGSRRISNFSRSAAPPFPFTFFVKGNSYPVVCTQHDAGDSGFLLSGLARKGGSRFLCLDWVTVLVRSPYSLGARDKIESRIHNKILLSRVLAASRNNSFNPPRHTIHQS